MKSEQCKLQNRIWIAAWDELLPRSNRIICFRCDANNVWSLFMDQLTITDLHSTGAFLSRDMGCLQVTRTWHTHIHTHSHISTHIYTYNVSALLRKYRRDIQIRSLNSGINHFLSSPQSELHYVFLPRSLSLSLRQCVFQVMSKPTLFWCAFPSRLGLNKGLGHFARDRINPVWWLDTARDLWSDTLTQ